MLKQREEVGVALVDAERVVGDRRRKGAGVLAGKVEDRLRRLGMRNARLEVIVGDDCIGDDVEFRLGANPGEATLPLSKVASGGELAGDARAAPRA